MSSAATMQGPWPPFQRASKTLVDLTQRMPWGGLRGGRASNSTVAALVGLVEGFVAHGSVQGAITGCLWGFGATLASEKIRHVLDDHGYLKRAAGPPIKVTVSAAGKEVELQGHGFTAGVLGALAGIGQAFFSGHTGFELISTIVKGAIIGFTERFAVTFAAEQVVSAANFVPDDLVSTVVGDYIPNGKTEVWPIVKLSHPPEIETRHGQLHAELANPKAFDRAVALGRPKAEKWLWRHTSAEIQLPKQVFLSPGAGDKPYRGMKEPGEHRVRLKLTDGEIDSNDPAWSFIRVNQDYINGATNDMVMWAVVRAFVTSVKKKVVSTDGQSVFMTKGPFTYAEFGPARTPGRILQDELDQEMSTALTDYLAYVICEFDFYDANHRKAEAIRKFASMLEDRHGPNTKEWFHKRIVEMFITGSLEPMLQFMVPPDRELNAQHQAAVLALIRSGQWADAWTRAQEYAVTVPGGRLDFEAKE